MVVAHAAAASPHATAGLFKAGHSLTAVAENAEQRRYYKPQRGTGITTAGHTRSHAFWSSPIFLLKGQTGTAAGVFRDHRQTYARVSQRRSDYPCPWVRSLHVNYDGSAGVPGRGHTHLCAAASMTNLMVKDRRQRRRMIPLTNLTPDDEAGPDCNPLVFAT